MYLEISLSYLGHLSCALSLELREFSVTVETSPQGHIYIYRLMVRMSKNKSEKNAIRDILMKARRLTEPHKKIIIFLFSYLLVTNWQRVGFIYVTATYSYTEVKYTIYSDE